MKKIIFLIIGVFFAGKIFATTYTFNLYGLTNVSGIETPKYGSRVNLDSRGQNFTMTLNVNTSDAAAVKRNLQTLISPASQAGLSVEKTEISRVTTGQVCLVTFAVAKNESGVIRTFDFTYNFIGSSNKVSFNQPPVEMFRLSPREIFILPNRSYILSLSGSQSGKTYTLYKNNTKVTDKTGTGNLLTFALPYGALTAGLVDTYTLIEGDNEFGDCTVVYFDEIAEMRYQTETANEIVDYSGGNIVVRCEWPGYDIGQLFQIIELMNDGSYSYAWDNQNVTISVADYDESSYCILNFSFTANTGATARTFKVPFLFNDGNPLTFQQHGEDPTKNQKNWMTHTRYNSASGDSKTTTTIYYDGLKRPIQQVLVKAAADQSKKDVIRHIEYDALGRNDSKVYLPYAKEQQYPGSYDANPIDGQRAYYTAAFGEEGNYAYTETEYEKSALNRIISQRKVGKVYRDAQKQIDYAYAANGANDVLRIVADSTAIGFSVNGYAERATLYKNTVTDEDGNVNIAYYNAENQLLVQRKVNDNNYLDTYFTYDDFGRVTTVIPPQASRSLTLGMQCTITTELFDHFCYGYKYDHNGNVTEKKIPGKEIEYFVYDKGGRLVLYQDGVLRSSGYWAYNTYDIFDNPVSNKIVECVSAQLDRNAIQQKFAAETSCRSVKYDAADSFIPYAGFGSDFSEVTLLKETEYYGFGAASADAPAPLTFKTVSGIASSDDVKESRGNKKYEKIKNLDAGNLLADAGYTERVFYYDAKSRLLQMVEQHPNGNLSRFSYKYDFNDNVIATQEAHTVDGRTDSLNTRHNIYNGGQLTSSVRNLNNSVDATINYSYDELGRTVAKDYGSAANNLTETYEYNIQGWLTGQSSERFSAQLRYYDPKRGATPSYTGNITEWQWSHPDLYMSGNFSPDAIMPDSCCYLYSYDNLSQLRNSQLMGYDPYFGAWMEMNIQGEALSYDYNGNISTLRRQDMNGNLADDFSYTYAGNRLVSLGNNGQSYTYDYDANGNMTKDGLNALKLKYNCLNLVGEVTDLNNNPKAKYAYLADGTKLGVKDRLNRNGYEYYGTFRYAVVNGVRKLESVPYEGGRIVVSTTGSGTNLTYAYNINAYTTDHLMSVRGAKYNVSDSAYEDYYSFGKGWENPSYSSNFDKYTYNGKEMQTTGWLPYLDYGARMYDARIGRWFGIDPLAEKYYATSPYAFCANNPINLVDWFGLKPESDDSYDLDGGTIEVVIIYGYRNRPINLDFSADLWRANLRYAYSNNSQPVQSTMDYPYSYAYGSATGGRGGVGDNRSSFKKPQKDSWNRIKGINETADIAFTFANEIFNNRVIKYVGNASSRMGQAMTAVEIYSMVNDGEFTDKELIDTAIDLIGWFGVKGLISSISLQLITRSFMYLYDQYVIFEHNSKEWFKAKIVSGYMP